MIFWHEYKEFKKLAEHFIETGETDNEEIRANLYILYDNEQTKSECIENIINILSNGDHFSKY